MILGDSDVISVVFYWNDTRYELQVYSAQQAEQLIDSLQALGVYAYWMVT